MSDEDCLIPPSSIKLYLPLCLNHRHGTEILIRYRAAVCAVTASYILSSPQPSRHLTREMLPPLTSCIPLTSWWVNALYLIPRLLLQVPLRGMWPPGRCTLSTRLPQISHRLVTGRCHDIQLSIQIGVIAIDHGTLRWLWIEVLVIWAALSCLSLWLIGVPELILAGARTTDGIPVPLLLGTHPHKDLEVVQSLLLLEHVVFEWIPGGLGREHVILERHPPPSSTGTSSAPGWFGLIEESMATVPLCFHLFITD